MEKELSIASGTLKGLENNGIYEFHGIPYAQAPIGALRFALPQPVQPWTGIYDATYRHPIAPQGASDLDLPMGPVTISRNEDCLTLSVSTPSLEEHLPVAVWLHGGANCYGGGDLPWYDGAALAKAAHIVVVCLNFRLGPLGFFCHPQVNAHTLSIEDQILALHWIQDNIKAFGGNPDKVTLFGQSAGGNAIAHLLSRPDTEGLFHQIILESASLGRGNHTLNDAFTIGEDLVKQLHLSPYEEKSLAEQLQEKTPDEILDAAARISPELYAKHQGMIFKPVKDEWHTPEQTAHTAAQEAIRRRIRIMTGMTKDEIHAFVLERDPETLKKASEGQRLRYDLPGHMFAQEAADGGCDVWKYRFDWSAPESIFDACHCLELPFVFGNLDAWDAPMLKGASHEELAKLRDTMQHYWGLFFRMEEPSQENWPKYSASSALLKCFDNLENPIIPEPDYTVPAD